MVLTHSEISIFSETIVEMIFEVNVDRMFALTPLPSPSASTQMVVSSPEANTTRSPQSCKHSNKCAVFACDRAYIVAAQHFVLFYKTVEADINAQIIHLHLPLSAL